MMPNLASPSSIRTTIAGVVGFAIALTLQVRRRRDDRTAASGRPPVHRAQADRLQRSRRLRLDLRRQDARGLGRQSEVLARRGRRDRRRVHAERPSGNSYIAYRRMEAKDFTLKFEIKVEGTGGSGIQYAAGQASPGWRTFRAECDRVQLGR